MINIAMLSRWHAHADNYVKQLRGYTDACITCVWDEDAKRGADWARELGVDFEADLNKLLMRSDVDGVVVDAPTADHCSIMVAAANAGKHIFTEKAMALTPEQCREIAEAVAKNNVKFCISHPHLINPHIQFAEQLMKDGLLGKVKYMRMRSAHDGISGGWLPDYWYDVEKTGGGAMIDLGCHPMYTASYLLGKPLRIASVFSTEFAPPNDDNSVSVVEFENNVIAVLEASFVTPYSAQCFELLGTEGAMVQTGKELKYRSRKLDVDGWIVPDKLPEPKPMPIRMWLDGIGKGTPIPFDTTRGEKLTELLQKAYVSHNEQRIVEFDA